MAEVFNPELLAMYYDHFFPYNDFSSWLSYGEGEKLLGLREFSFTLENDTYIRYQSFRAVKDMREAIIKRQPHKIDIGAVFSISPEDKSKVPDSEFVPTQRELVFDIDLTDYDDVRTCCNGATICNKCWQLIISAVRVMDVALREVDDFGFQHLLWVYSGRRGIHCWVADESARLLTNEARTAIVHYFTIVEGNENTKRKAILRDPIHPSLDRAFRILEPIFENHVIGEEGQGILCSPTTWNQLLDMLPSEDLRVQLNEIWSQKESTPKKKWMDVKTLVQMALSKRKNDVKKLRTCIAEIVFAYTYPRLDANVTKQRNHLLKSPFAVHPKTGRVCVPVDPSTISTFDPFKVPTLIDLEQSILNNDQNDTPLTQYTQFFSSHFLKKLENDQRLVRRDESERDAAISGNW